MIGVYDSALTEPIANVLRSLGTQAAFVVHGADGLDELSTTGVNIVSHLKQGFVSTFEFDPLDLGLERAAIADFIGGAPEENAKITRAILSGEDRGPRRDIVLLNAAAALTTVTDDWAVGLEQARQSINSGAALTALNTWIGKTQQL